MNGTQGNKRTKGAEGDAETIRLVLTGEEPQTARGARVKGSWEKQRAALEIEAIGRSYPYLIS